MEFLGWFEDPETLYIAMEYLEEGDLTNHMDTPLPQGTVQNISKQILEGLEVMHQQGIAHRDLKPAVWSLTPNTSLSYIASQNTDEYVETARWNSVLTVWVKCPHGYSDFGEMDRVSSHLSSHISGHVCALDSCLFSYI